MRLRHKNKQMHNDRSKIRDNRGYSSEETPISNKKEIVPAMHPLFDADILSAKVYKEQIENVEPLMYTENTKGAMFHNIPNPISVSLSAMIGNAIDPFYNNDNSEIRDIRNESLAEQIVYRMKYNILHNLYVIYHNGFYTNLLPHVQEDKVDEFRNCFSAFSNQLYAIDIGIKSMICSYGANPCNLPQQVNNTEILFNEAIAYAYNVIILNILEKNIVYLDSLADTIIKDVGGNYSEADFMLSFRSVAVSVLNDMATSDMYKVAEFIHIVVFKELSLYNKLYQGFN